MAAGSVRRYRARCASRPAAGTGTGTMNEARTRGNGDTEMVTSGRRHSRARRLAARALLQLCLVAAMGSCRPAVITTDEGPALSPTRLKYRLEQGRTLFYCDPDYYPIGRGDELARALEVFPTIAADTEKYAAILEHLGLAATPPPSDSTKLRIYRESKRLASITLNPSGDDFAFQLREQEAKGSVFTVAGTVTRSGQVLTQTRTASYGGCPICLLAGTRIATPGGEVPVQALRSGGTVWTTAPGGARVAAPLLRVEHVVIPPSQLFVHLKLTDGRELFASPGHPTVGGRRLAELARGDTLAGTRVRTAGRVFLRDTITYDILPAGGSGAYWANGIPLGSTLAAPVAERPGAGRAQGARPGGR